MEYISHYDSPLGRITLAGNSISLTGLWFDGQRYFGASLASEYEERDTPVIVQTKRWLDIYFSGRDPGFNPQLCLRGTPFQKDVWDILQTIPFSHVVTYGGLAQMLAVRRNSGKVSPRAIGAAVGRNPVSLIVPCHRVIGSNGSLVGYAGGVERKEKLLLLEKTDFESLRSNTKNKTM